MSPGLEAAMNAMDTSEHEELSRRKQIAELLSSKQKEFVDLVSAAYAYTYM